MPTYTFRSATNKSATVVADSEAAARRLAMESIHGPPPNDAPYTGSGLLLTDWLDDDPAEA